MNAKWEPATALGLLGAPRSGKSVKISARTEIHLSVGALGPLEHTGKKGTPRGAGWRSGEGRLGGKERASWLWLGLMAAAILLLAFRSTCRAQHLPMRYQELHFALQSLRDGKALRREEAPEAGPSCCLTLLLSTIWQFQCRPLFKPI